MGIEQDLIHIHGLFRRLAAVLQQRGVPLDGIDGGLELMGDIGDEIRLDDLRGAQFPGHPVEVIVDVPDLPDVVGRLQMDTEVALAYLAHGTAQPGDGSEDQQAQQHAQHAAEDHAEDQHPQSCRQVEVEQILHDEAQDQGHHGADEHLAQGHQHIVGTQSQPQGRLLPVLFRSFRFLFHSLTTL